ncbi:MAG: hypothetical protein JWN86_3422 [Planctomycetota bacterium]|nr:hypothetical protein [Planctomycetota bacterium]
MDLLRRPVRLRACLGLLGLSIGVPATALAGHHHGQTYVSVQGYLLQPTSVPAVSYQAQAYSPSAQSVGAVPAVSMAQAAPMMQAVPVQMMQVAPVPMMQLQVLPVQLMQAAPVQMVQAVPMIAVQPMLMATPVQVLVPQHRGFSLFHHK